MHKLIISAPFGNYIRHDGITSTLGTFTRYARRTDQRSHNQRFWWAGMLWRAATTIRYRKSLGGWTNRMGLRNPGIDSLCRSRLSTLLDIVSIHGFDDPNVVGSDWFYLLDVVRKARPKAVELNFSCPNVKDGDGALFSAIDRARDVVQMAQALVGRRMTIIAKVPPLETFAWLMMLREQGIRVVAHCCNTVPCRYGGLSGEHVRNATLDALWWARRGNNFPNPIIAGGGVQSLDDVKRYIDLGADHVAVASMLFNPRKHKLLKVMRDYLNETQITSTGRDSCPA